MHDFPRLFQQAYDSLSPGGWFEIVDFTAGIFSDDESTEKSPHLLEWRDRLIEASRVFGKPLGVSSQYSHWMTQTGFANVRQEVIQVRLPVALKANIPRPADPSRSPLARGRGMLR